MQAIEKARAWADKVRPAKTPRVFAPPYGGSGYTSQGFNFEQVLH